MTDQPLTVSMLLDELRRMFAKSFTDEYREAWGPIYHQALAKYDGDRLGRAWRNLLLTWKYRSPPTPADMIEACEHTRGRRGRAYADLSDDALIRKAEFWSRIVNEGGPGAYGLDRIEAELSRRGLHYREWEPIVTREPLVPSADPFEPETLREPPSLSDRITDDQWRQAQRAIAEAIKASRMPAASRAERTGELEQLSRVLRENRTS